MVSRAEHAPPERDKFFPQDQSRGRSPAQRGIMLFRVSVRYGGGGGRAVGVVGLAALLLYFRRDLHTRVQHCKDKAQDS